ncbi:TRAM domain-containing protein [Candidatus Woesearchaeota archaeon]|nr:TRAM domain-containing protein [Candidatus Woesearchaeota archaeon]
MYRQGSRDFGHQRSFAPIRVGQELDVKIEAVGEKGDGIAKVKGFVIFVPNTKTGDEVKIRINKVSKKVGFGQVIDSASGDREEEFAEDSDKTDEIDQEEAKEDQDYAQEEAKEDSDTFGEDEEGY